MGNCQSAKSFASNSQVRWCPGCGDYAVLKALQQSLAASNIPKENIVIVSGIGCAGRMPYYLNIYGIHGLHGRAAAIATGLKLARPELTIWVVMGDGDGLSIGAGHLYHCLRRDLDVNILLLNNQVYGLTKGQTSPTSQPGQITSTSLHGVDTKPVDPIQFALGAGGSFVARGIDVDNEGLTGLMQQAMQHQGTSFIEVLQHCPVFNQGAFQTVRDKSSRTDNVMWLTPDEPFSFGIDNDKILHWREGEPVISLSADVTIDALPKHRPNSRSIIPAWRLTELAHPEYPLPIGIFRQVGKNGQFDIVAKSHFALDDVNDVLHHGQTWHV